MRARTSLILASLLISGLSGCERAEAPEPEAKSSASAVTSVQENASAKTSGDVRADHRFQSWAGRWTGVEGMYLLITLTKPASYQLEMQSNLDEKGNYAGVDSEHGIQFQRAGQQHLLRRATGQEIGLKYLADKQDCLIVQQGEGYCRDGL